MANQNVHIQDFFPQIVSFLAGLASGSFLTFKFSKSLKVSDNGKVVSQDGARAQGDVVGGNKTTRIDR